MKNLLVLCSSICLFFLFPPCLKGHIQKNIAESNVRVYCICFLLGVLWFQFLHLSLIHFEFIFVQGVRKGVVSIFSHVSVQFSQHHLLKRLSLPRSIFLPPLSNINWPYRCVFSSGSLFCSIDLCVFFYAIALMFWLLVL